MLLIQSCTSSVQENAISSIDICIKKSSPFLTSDELTNIDRAYVRTENGVVDIIFSKGALGTFEKRSKNYEPIFFCILNDPMNLVYLDTPSKGGLIEKEGGEELDFKSENIIEQLFVIVGGRYVLKGEQRLSEDNLIKHNPKIWEPKR